MEFEFIIENKNILNYCLTRGKNYIIIFHLPNEIPTYIHGDNYIEIGKDKLMYIEPKIFSTDESLRKYDPNIRKCYFEGKFKYLIKLNKKYFNNFSN
jgi:hypothetical protein